MHCSWFILSVCCASVAFAAHHGWDANDGGNNNGDMVPADKNFLKRQMQILRLLKNMHEQNHDQEQQQIGNSFNLEQEASNFSNSQVSKAMGQMMMQGMLPRHVVFDMTNNQQRLEAIRLFDLFFFAKDYDTFYRAACWARDRVNAGQFVYALHVAVMHRPETQGMVLPPIYEVHPQLFVDSMAMQKIYNAKMQGQDNFQVQANYSNCPSHCQFGDCQNHPNSANCKNCQNCDLVNGNNNNNNNNDNDNNNNGNSGYNFNSNNNPSNEVSYFNEDVGMNAFNYYFNMMYPSWMDSQKYGVNKARQGEQFLYQNQQLLARYNLERYSNNLDAVQPLQVQQNGAVCIQEGHNPSMSFENGDNMPNRPDNFCVDQNNNNNNNQNGQNNNNNNFNTGENDNNNCGNSPSGNSCGHNGMNANQKINHYRRRIYDAIDAGVAYRQDGSKVNLNEQENGADTLGRIIQANSDFVNSNYYGNNGFFNEVQKMVGKATDPFNRHSAAPAAVSNYETTLRDPAFFSLLADVYNMQQYYKSKQPAYTSEDLAMNGVQIQNVDVDKMMTYFENFFMDANNAVKQGNNENGNNNNNNNNYQVRQQRLNHKPFSYNMNVQSNQASDAIVRVFIGPKTNPTLNNNNQNNNNNNNNNNSNNQQGMPLEQARPFFVEIDRFKVNLKEGQNKISRNAKSSPMNVNDQQTYEKLQQKTQQAYDGSSQFLIAQADQHHCGWPKRMQLPKGKNNGQEFTMFFMINPVENKNNNNNKPVDNYLTCSNQKVFDNRPLGFPFDRPVNSAEWNDNVNNAFFKNVFIYHKNGKQNAF